MKPSGSLPRRSSLVPTLLVPGSWWCKGSHGPTHLPDFPAGHRCACFFLPHCPPDSGLSFPFASAPPRICFPTWVLGTIEGESLSAFRSSCMKNGSQHNIQRGELELSDKEGIAVLIWGWPSGNSGVHISPNEWSEALITLQTLRERLRASCWAGTRYTAHEESAMTVSFCTDVGGLGKPAWRGPVRIWRGHVFPH